MPNTSVLYYFAKTDHMMIKTIIAACFLLVIAHSISAYPFRFPAGATNSYESPSYPIGYIDKNTSVSINLDLPFGGAILDSSTVSILIKDSSNSNIIETLSCNGGTSCLLTWNATSSASFYINILSNDAGLEFNSLVIYYLMVRKGNNVLLRVSDVLRQKVVKYFRTILKGKVTFTLNPVVDVSLSFLSLLTMSSAAIRTVVRRDDLIPDSVTNSVATYTTDLEIGYYAIVVFTDVFLSVSGSVPSEAYPCPYSLNFPDYYATFPGCIQQDPNAQGNGLPCVAYDYTFQKCLQCMSGYSVSNGICVYSTTCGQRQYFNFGQCTKVNSLCNTYDPYTGDCFSCLDSKNYQVIYGKCVSITTGNCLNGYRSIGSLCVSETCGNYDITNGLCITCATTAYYLSQGFCLPINCGQGKYYSVFNTGCAMIPSTCQYFSILSQSCIQCNMGFYLSNGACYQNSNIVNCRTYNFAANLCSLCDTGFQLQAGLCKKFTTCNAGEIYINGVCIVNPGLCSSQQQLINNLCVNLPTNCKQLNLFYQCSQCADSYQLQAGDCIKCTGNNPNFPCITCPANSYVDSLGRCQPANEYCNGYNALTGSCLACINGAAPVNGVCCNVGYYYQTNGCIQQGGSITIPPNNQGGQGTNDDSYKINCKLANIKMKICLQCLGGRTIQNGICA